MRRKEFAVGAVALCALLALPAAAQTNCTNTSGSSCSLTNTASATVGALISLDISGLTTTLTAPTSLTLGTDVGVDNGPTFTVKANRDWQLSIKSGNATEWDYVGSSSGVKPIGHLKWSAVSGGTYAAVDAVGATLASSASASNGAAASVFYKTTWAAAFNAASNAPGVYSLPVVFTLSAP